jgi:hypothetical protein
VNPVTVGMACDGGVGRGVLRWSVSSPLRFLTFTFTFFDADDDDAKLIERTGTE